LIIADTQTNPLAIALLDLALAGNHDPDVDCARRVRARRLIGVVAGVRGGAQLEPLIRRTRDRPDGSREC
jgi:hypothetical protein